MRTWVCLLAAGLLVTACYPPAADEDLEEPPVGSEPAAAAAQDPATDPVAEARDRAASKQTIAGIRNVGTAMFSWLTDNVGAAAAGQSEMPGPVDFDQYPVISYPELVQLLVPDYIREVPEHDGWGHPYEYHLSVADPMSRHSLAIRSAGRDGVFSAPVYAYANEGFDAASFDEDIAWADGYFIRWPKASWAQPPPRD